MRNAVDRLRLRQANRLFSQMHIPVQRTDLVTIEAGDVLASRVFQGVVEGADPSIPLTESPTLS